MHMKKEKATYVLKTVLFVGLISYLPIFCGVCTEVVQKLLEKIQYARQKLRLLNVAIT
jgi:hypothetical protein